VPHKYNVGASVYFQGGGLTPGARGTYKVVRHLPVERDNRLTYRIKNVTENFERIADANIKTRQGSFLYLSAPHARIVG
jgi:hypothetical protein